MKLIFCSIYFVWTFISVLHVAFASNTKVVFTEKQVSEIAAQLISNCDPSACHSASIAKLITHGPLSQHHQIMHILNEKGPFCLRFALEAVKNELEQYKLPSTCEGLIDKDKRACENAQTEYASVNDRVLSLVNLMVSQQTNLITPFVSHLGYESPSPYMNTGLFDLLQGLEDKQSCSDYKIGEERQFIITPFQSVILHYVHYRIKRESAKHYKAFVVMEFSPDSSSYKSSPVPGDQVHDYYIGRVRDCLSRANPRMKGQNGETLEIVIEDARQVDSCMPKRLIQVGYSPDRISSTTYYQNNIGCVAIVHEVIHLLGLWDEYKKIGTSYFRPSYDCRVVQKNSILSDYKARWNNVFVNKFDNSLLDPSHFQAILYGNCSLRDDVKLYRQCSRLSYQTLSNGNACLDQKAYCESQNVLGRNKILEQHKIREEIQTLQAEWDLLETRLQKKPELSYTNPNSHRRKAQRQALLVEQKRVKRRINLLEERSNFVLTWPDQLAPSP